MTACTFCGHDLGNPPAVYCPNCGRAFGAGEAPGKAPGSPPARSGPSCPNCRIAMTGAGELQFRVGGSAGGSGFLLGNWNQLSEALQPFAVYHCPSCGRVDLYESGR
ncbi:MAG TPA: hypothetical protein VEG66_02995 [Thermoplasmata archaeon]|nr:hypothetical protein [Thermoplasmata archaeon]HYB78712.1 hypothetical protein [Thermoplasmata archaeon]